MGGLVEQQRFDGSFGIGNLDDVAVNLAKLFVGRVVVVNGRAEAIPEFYHVGVMRQQMLVQLLDIFADLLGVFVNFHGTQTLHDCLEHGR